ncbi:hypothetical protein IJH24_03140 [Candidatus Saccharibacteria bacterium]|nr:hypothetical protein [Candidatus Saccharibacteria bacterium]
MFYVINDLHGAKKLIEKAVEGIKHLDLGDVLIINGDGAGARGPIMNNLVKIFYEVRRGETEERKLLEAIEKIIDEEPVIPKEWIYDAVHAGLFRKLMADKYEKFARCLRKELYEVLEETLEPLSDAARERGVQILYLPGNGEITPEDFSTEDYTTEIAVPPEKRFYQCIAKDGYFERFGIEYVPYATKLSNGSALISTNMLDLDERQAVETLCRQGLLDGTLKEVIVHYPPAIAPIGGAFSFWVPNKMDIKRSDALKNILDILPLEEAAQIYFGHIHLGANDQRMDLYPSSMSFIVTGYQCTWVKPGTVLKI